MTYFPKKIRIDYDTADAIFVATLREVIKNIKKFGDEPKSDAKLIKACKLLLGFMGKP